MDGKRRQTILTSLRESTLRGAGREKEEAGDLRNHRPPGDRKNQGGRKDEKEF